MRAWLLPGGFDNTLLREAELLLQYIFSGADAPNVVHADDGAPWGPT